MLDIDKIAAEGIKVTLNGTGDTWLLGSGGVTFSDVVEHRALEKVEADPSSHIGNIVVDVPAYIPVEDLKLRLDLTSGPCTVYVSKQKRGNEKFSSFDTTTLPYFTRLLIKKEGIVKDPVAVIKDVLGYFDDFLDLVSVGIGPLKSNDRFSIVIYYDRKDNPGHPVARSVYPLTGKYVLPNPHQPIEFSPELQLALNKYRLELASKATRTAQATEGEPFPARVLAVIHDFSFFAKQHAQSLASLDEETIRDLCLVPLKATFRNAEGEAFNFNGTTDIKISNPNNSYEYGIIEFKKWHGVKSFRDVYSQTVREHATGQEVFLIVVILSENEDVGQVKIDLVESFSSEVETVEVRPDEKIVPSKEIFFCGTVKIRSNHIPLTIGIVDLYFKNVRAA